LYTTLRGADGKFRSDVQLINGEEDVDVDNTDLNDAMAITDGYSKKLDDWVRPNCNSKA
jgi:hypothetical protein